MRARAVRRLATLAGGCGLSLAALGSCAEPTAIDVEVHSELGCAEAPDVLLFGGTTLSELSDRAPSASATRCDPEPGGGVHRGRVVIVPSADEAIAFALTTRAGADASACLRDPNGCVIAKRSVRPIARRTLRVRVDPRRSCVGVPCGIDETCDDGRCVSATAQCVEGVCGLGGADAGDAGTVLVPGTLALGRSHTCYVATGAVKCWGSNQFGQLGDGTMSFGSLTPKVVGGIAPVEQIAAGDAHTCARGQGAIRCWGSNDTGQIGDGTAGGTRPLPTIALSGGASHVTLGASHSCALVGSSELRCWGLNDGGQLGDGTTMSRSAAVTVPGSFLLPIAGKGHTCATLDIDVGPGFTRCWGNNANGEGGNGTTKNPVLAPEIVVGLPSTPTVVACGGHSCAIAGDKVYCWGPNGSGQLGDGSTVPRNVATPVVGLPPSAVSVTVGREHTCARAANGDVWCWGSNASGQLGDGTTTTRMAPVLVLRGAAEVVAGVEHTCAVLTAGGLRCWGSNGTGQLGDGSTLMRTVPTEVVGFP